jgi:hypothetical protein
MEMHKVPPTWLGLDMMLCGPVVYKEEMALK